MNTSRSGRLPPQGSKGMGLTEDIREQMRDAEDKAWEALSGYKFIMFGYHASRWVNYNKLLDQGYTNPFRELVKLAREKTD